MLAPMRLGLVSSLLVHAVVAWGLLRMRSAPVQSPEPMSPVSITLVEPDTGPANRQAASVAQTTRTPRRSVRRPQPVLRPQAVSPERARPVYTIHPAEQPTTPPQAVQGIDDGALPVANKPGVGPEVVDEAAEPHPSDSLAGAVASRSSTGLGNPPWERISQAIQRRIAYPVLARRRGLQGQTTVSFRLSDSGEVSELRVVASSGHDLLDAAAMQAVLRATPLPAPAQATVIVMPIVFALR
jgi:protein TonB